MGIVEPDELLNDELFLDINDARRKIEAWRVDYNGTRPHTALSDMTPEALPFEGGDPQPRIGPVHGEASRHNSVAVDAA